MGNVLKVMGEKPIPIDDNWLNRRPKVDTDIINRLLRMKWEDFMAPPCEK